MGRIFRMNAPEWPWIVSGALASLITGAIHPIFAVMLSELVAVSEKVCVLYNSLQLDIFVYSLFPSFEGRGQPGRMR